MINDRSCQLLTGQSRQRPISNILADRGNESARNLPTVCYLLVVSSSIEICFQPRSVIPAVAELLFPDETLNFDL